MFDQKKIINMIEKATNVQQNMKDQLMNVKVSGSSGGGMVCIDMNGHFEILSLKINQNIVDKDDINFLEDMIISAMNDALSKVKKETAAQMKLITSKSGF